GLKNDPKALCVGTCHCEREAAAPIEHCSLGAAALLALAMTILVNRYLATCPTRKSSVTSSCWLFVRPRHQVGLLLAGALGLLSHASHAQTRVAEWVSTTPTAAWVKQSAPTASSTGAADVTINLQQPQQTITGFGACFNELGWTSLSALGAADREKIMRELFAPGVGANFTICRMPVGANDFSRDWYSYDETPGDFAMTNFSIANDEQTLIPFIKNAQRYRPGLQLWASPWSPPTWMKYNHHYAAAAVFPSCPWTATGLARFVGYLGPQMQQRKVDVFFGTMERANEALVDTVLRDPRSAKYIKGVGFQWAGKGAIAGIHKRYPELALYQSEQECGDGKNDWKYCTYTWDLMKQYLGNGANSYLYWNISLKKGGISRW
nr:hypothetical protein [Tanacetum cinerariifolium]